MSTTYPPNAQAMSCSKSIALQEGSGAANGADEALDNEPEGTAASAKTSSPEPSDGGTDKTLEGVVQVRGSIVVRTA